MVFFGLISYSLYLWHYPIFAFYRYEFQSGQSDNLYKYYVIIFLFLISIISFFLIEKPFRNKKLISFKKLILILVFFILVIIFLIKNLINKSDQNKMYGKISLNDNYYKTEINNMLKNTSNYIFDNNHINIIIFGDSLADDSYLMFKTNSELFKNYKFRKASYSSVLKYTDEKISNSFNYPDDNDYFEKTDIFFLSSRNISFDDIETIVNKLKNVNKKIILNTSIESPHPGILNVTLLDKFIWNKKRLPNEIELHELNRKYLDYYISNTSIKNYNKKIEEEREIERIKQKEIMEREKENMRKILEKDKRCGICNINYCKCDKPNFVKNEYNKTICNSCKKYKCMCVRITDFFKK